MMNSGIRVWFALVASVFILRGASGSCVDNRRNGDEVDVDCGGSCGTCGTWYPSCEAVFDEGLPGGAYLVQPGGATDAFLAYCDGGWMMVMQELGTGSIAGPFDGQLRFLGQTTTSFATFAQQTTTGNIGPLLASLGVSHRAQVRVTFGNSEWVEFFTETQLFANTPDLEIPIYEMAWSTNGNNVFSRDTYAGPGDGFFCRAAASPSSRPGDTSWGVTQDRMRECGCNSGSWLGSGMYYGGSLDCTSCGCWGGAFAGFAPHNYQKGAQRGVDFQLWIKRVGQPTCFDKIKDGDETGIDCGGSCPAICTTCFDHIQNGDETGVDCGGSCPPCAATCHDNIRNGDEVGIDCGGVCSPCADLYASCSAVFAEGLPSGSYFVQPPGATAGFFAYCDGGWMLVLQEYGTGDINGPFTGALRFLGESHTTFGQFALGNSTGNIGPLIAAVGVEERAFVRINFGTFPSDLTSVVQFVSETQLFENDIDKFIPIRNLSWTAGGEEVFSDSEGWFCRAAASPDERPGDTSWGITQDDRRSCGCNSGSWEGGGVYYGGSLDCTSCSCWGGGFAGFRANGAQKGGLRGVDVQMWIKSVNESPAWSCVDEIRNGDETGVDCGGSCNPCEGGGSCFDEILNGDEIGVDCGGSCNPCEDGGSCFDEIRNGDETGVDCGGSCNACEAVVRSASMGSQHSQPQTLLVSVVVVAAVIAAVGAGAAFACVWRRRRDPTRYQHYQKNTV